MANQNQEFTNQDGGNQAPSQEKSDGGGNTDGNRTQRSGTSERGFAAMDRDQQREIARKGGAAVSQNREHMAAIGRKGGEASGGGNRGAANRPAGSAPQNHNEKS